MSITFLKGIVPAIVTPLCSSGKEIDEDSARNLVDFLIDNQVHGLFALGSTGECAYLDNALRQRMAAIVIDQANGRLPVIIHVGAQTLEDVLDLSYHAVSTGSDGIALIPPYYYTMDDLAMEQFFSKVAEAIHIPIYLYNIPMNAKNNIKVSMFVKLAKSYPHIMGMKDSSMNFENFYELIQEKESKHSAIMGNDAQILPALAVGGQGAVSAGATAIPEPFVKLYNAFLRGDMDDARKWQGVCAQVKKMFVKPYPIAPQKKVLELRGITGPTVRAPLRQMTIAETEELTRNYESIKQLL